MPGLQSLPELANAEFMPMYLQQRVLQQADQANQYNQGAMQGQQQEIEAATLQNMFNRQNNPLKLESSRLANEGQGYANTIAGVNADIKQSLSAEEKKAKAAEYTKALSDADLAQFMNQAKLDMMSDDPATAKRGANKFNMSAEEQSRRNKHADDMDKQRLVNQGSADVANIHAAASRYGADQRGKASASGGAPWGKSYESQVAYFANAIQEAQANGDAEGEQKARDMLQLVQQAQASKPAVVSQGMRGEGQIAMPAGVATTPNRAPGPAQMPGASARPAAPAGTVSVISPD